MHIVWTREALNRLTEIEKYISKNSQQRGINFVNYLIDQGETLKDNPRIGRIVREIDNENIRELIAKKYRIIYRVSEERVEILTVFEGHRLLRIEELGIN